MPTTPFIAQHRNGTSGHRRKAEQDMDADNRQEKNRSVDGIGMPRTTVMLSCVMLKRLMGLSP